MHVLQAMQVLMSSKRPCIAFWGILGSAISPLPMQTRSAFWDFKISLAINGSLILPTVITGMFTAFLIFSAESARQAFFMKPGWQIHSGVASLPAETWTISIPAPTRIFKIRILSSTVRPPGTNSWALILKDRGKSLPIRFLISWTTFPANRVLPFVSPPYSSSLMFENPERNWLIR